MPSNNKAIREIVGYTFPKIGRDPQGWYNQAQKFHMATNLLFNDESLQQVALFTAGLSIELALKAIILFKSRPFLGIHQLNKLAAHADVKVSSDQECTLELLSECILWRGRYPTPKNEDQWDKFYDEILAKHIVHKTDGNVYSTLIHRSRFPTPENYNALWLILEDSFYRLVK